jgi:hypothetical protein
MPQYDTVRAYWDAGGQNKIQAARDLSISVALHHVNDWLCGSLSHLGVTLFLTEVEPETIMRNTGVRVTFLKWREIQ